jgi:tetratricopeptide (TPR) repeat protein
VHTPEAQAGLGCMMCHSIAQVKSTMGQADFFLEYPKLHELAASKNPAMVWLHDFMVRLNPEPHRRVFLKPFMKNQTAEFCSSCHKVHLDVPVNNYRWVRGFNEYDNWQASGVSGQGARSFYYPERSQKCADCHMPMEKSRDDGNDDGFVHSHRFPGANTAVPTANEDHEQLKITEGFLKSGALTIDIFALSRAQAQAGGAALPSADVNTTFAVGEEAETKAPSTRANEAAPVTAPLNRVNAVVRRGEDVRVDVVVRTKRVGHFFPGGTVDAYDTWVELKAIDENDKPIFWSGMVEDDGKGPVEKGAHFYRSLQIDAHGNPINKRNAWQGRAAVYVRLIPPGAADTIHYRLRIPENAGNKIKLEAKLNYRKFAWWNTQFSFAGVPDPKQPVQRTADYDDAKYIFTGEMKGLSAKQQKIPDVPIVAVAQNEVTLDVAAKNAPVPAPKMQLMKDDWQRWNDYGIGLLLQGDLKAAQQAFQKVTEIDPNNPDGWVNIGRAAVQEGDMESAQQVLDRALKINPRLARTNFFYAKVLRSTSVASSSCSTSTKRRSRNSRRCSRSTPRTCRPITTSCCHTEDSATPSRHASTRCATCASRRTNRRKRSRVRTANGIRKTTTSGSLSTSTFRCRSGRRRGPRRSRAQAPVQEPPSRCEPVWSQDFSLRSLRCVARSRSRMWTSPHRRAFVTRTTTERSERSTCRRQWGPAQRSSTTTTTAIPTSCS